MVYITNSLLHEKALEKQISMITQLIKNFPAFGGTLTFTVVFTRTFH
jgi:hypothetical protein